MKTPSIVLALGLCVGCSASNPEGNLPPSGPDAGVDPNQPVYVELDIDAPVATTPWGSLPITGVGPANGLLLYYVPSRGERTATLGSNGAFCIDVDLAPGDNSIRIEAVSADGDYSDPQTVSIRREGTPPEPEPEPPPGLQLGDRTAGTTYYKNADGSTINGVTLETGTFAKLVDNNESELVKVKGTWAANEAVAFRLPERMSIHGFEVHAAAVGGETCGPEAFEMWITTHKEPGMSFDGNEWVKVAEVSDGEYVSDATTYELPTNIAGIPAKFAAIRFTDASCGWGYDNVYGITEVRVIAETEGVTELPSTGAPSCATGGF